MTAIVTLGSDDTLVTVRNGWLYPLSRLLKCAYTAFLVGDFQKVGALIDAAVKTQCELEDACVIAVAARDAADAGLDPLIWQIINALLILTKNNREDPQFISYVGSRTPTQIVKPLLGAELVTAAEWVTQLEQETDPVLLAFVKPLAELVAMGQAAEKDVKSSSKAVSDFRLLGGRRKVVDAVNAARGSLLGALVKFQHDNAALRLPSDWAESFFQRSTRASKYGDTVEEAEASLLRLTEETKAAQENLAALKAKAAEREAAKAKRAQARVDLAASRKESREMRRQEKALEALAKKKL